MQRLEQRGGVGGAGGLRDLGLVLVVERLGVFEVVGVEVSEVDGGEGSPAGVVLLGDHADGVGGGEGEGGSGGPVDGGFAEAAEEAAGERTEQFAGVLFDDLAGHADADGGDELFDAGGGEGEPKGIADGVDHLGLKGDDGECGEILRKQFDRGGQDGVAENGGVTLGESGIDLRHGRGCGDLRERNRGGSGFVVEGVGEGNLFVGRVERLAEESGEVVKERPLRGRGGTVGFAHGQGGLPGEATEFVGGEEGGLFGGGGLLEHHRPEDVGEIGVAERRDDFLDLGPLRVRLRPIGKGGKEGECGEGGGLLGGHGGVRGGGLRFYVCGRQRSHR